MASFRRANPLPAVPPGFQAVSREEASGLVQEIPGTCSFGVTFGERASTAWGLSACDFFGTGHSAGGEVPGGLEQYAITLSVYAKVISQTFYQEMR